MTDQRKPTQKQQRLLRRLAHERGQTFAVPKTAADATAEIRRLMGTERSDPAEIRRERSRVSRDLAERAGGAPAVQRRELEGYGSTAGWANTNTPLLIVTHSRTEGTRLTGTVLDDGAAPILRRHGFRWSRDGQCWFVPNSRRRTPNQALLMRVERDLRVSNFEVDLQTE